jgi:arabinogalactan oligomer/maltooligosaccharide transport system substrate-binding protein
MHKRAMGAVAVTGIAALLMSACGGSSTPTVKASTKTAAAPASASTVAPVRDAAADLVIWADNDRVPVIQKYADEFGKENGIKVAVQVATDVRQQFKDATKVGKGPDVIVGAHDWLGELVQNNTVSPVNLSADEAGKFAPQAIAATKFNGQSYGVPYAVENIALVRNTALAPTAPTSMSDLVTQGQALVKAGKATNILLQEVGKTGNAFYT